jgi:hypothetical protein
MGDARYLEDGMASLVVGVASWSNTNAANLRPTTVMAASRTEHRLDRTCAARASLK